MKSIVIAALAAVAIVPASASASPATVKWSVVKPGGVVAKAAAARPYRSHFKRHHRVVLAKAARSTWS